MKYELSNEVTETLIEEGILDDDIRELELEGRCLFDDDNAKIVIGILIDANIEFNCRNKYDDLKEIELIEE